MDNKTLSLFDDIEFDGFKNGLTIVAGRKKKLSKNQQTFNKLTKRIEQLQKTIQTESVKLETLLKVYVKEIHEKKRLLAQNRLKMAKTLGNSTKTIKYGRRHYEDLRTVILILCDEAFEDTEPDEETERFYDAWSDTSYREGVQSQADMIKQEFIDNARQMFGIDIDPDDIEDTPEGFARFAKRVQEEFEGNQTNKDGHFSKQKKTKKQLEWDRLRKREEDLTKRSMRSIFLSLAKALHPDTITDPVEKACKEELMKKVTAAYADKDLTTLLKLEMEWVKSGNKVFDTLPDEQLKLFIASLKGQVETLGQELYALYMHPRFEYISIYAREPQSYAVKQIQKKSHEYGKVIRVFEDRMKRFSSSDPRKDILGFVKEYMVVMKHYNPFVDDVLNEFF